MRTLNTYLTCVLNTGAPPFAKTPIHEKIMNQASAHISLADYKRMTLDLQ